MASACGEFIMRCFHARTNLHIAHLQTKSFAAHKALNELYDGLVEKADAFAEAYQGIYGIERNYPAAYTYNEEGLTIATELRSWIDANRRRITDRSELQNLIDETVSLLDAQIYKLKFLH